MRKHLSFGIILSCCLLAFPSLASVPDSADVVNMLKEYDVMSSTAPKQVSSSSPLNRIDAGQIRRRGIIDVSDAVHRLPGVTLRDYGGAGGLKTVSVRGFGAAHTAVLYDGVAQTDAQTGQIDISRYSIDNLNDLSLLIGDNDDIFIPARAAASAAKLSINTMPVNYSTRKLVAQLRGGAFGYINPFLMLGIPLGKDISSSVVCEFTHSDNDYPFKLKNGDLTTTERRTNSRMNSGHAEANLSWLISPVSKMTAKAYFYDNSRRLPGPVVYYNNTSNEALKERNAFFQSTYRSALSSVISAMVNAKFNYSSSFYSDQSGKYPNGKLQQKYWQREYYASGALLYTPLQCWTFDYSIDYAFNNLNSNLPKNRCPFRHSVLQSATAKYKARKFTAMARLLYSAYINGAKEGIAANDASRLSPSASISFKPLSGQNLFFRLSYKNIYRVPTFSEAYFDHYGSEEILPEITDQINVGATYSRSSDIILQNISVSLDAYLNKIKDMIVAVPYNMFIWRMTNLGKVRVVGVDATLDAEFAVAYRNKVFLLANFSYQRAMPRTNRESSDWMKQVAYIPVHSGNFSVSWENPWTNFSFNASIVGERFTSNSNTPQTRISAYSDMGLSAWRQFQLKGCKLEIRANMLNIFNSQYQIIANYPMPGRSWQAAIKFTI